MGRLICFFSVGTGPRPANYVYADRAPFSSLSVLGADFQHGLVERQGRRVVFVLIATPETRGEPQQKIQQDLIGQGHYRPEEDGWEVIEVESGAPDGVQRTLRGMLERIAPGDEVFVEPTNGIRSISLALVFGALYIRVLRPDVQLGRMVYGDFSTNGKPSGLHDISRLLGVEEWARDAHTFGTLLLGQPLVEQLNKVERREVKQSFEGRASGAGAAARNFPKVGGSLERLSAALATTQAPLIIRELRSLDLERHALTDLVAREALGFFQREIRELQEAAARTTAEVLDGH